MVLERKVVQLKEHVKSGKKARNREIGEERRKQKKNQRI